MNFILKIPGPLLVFLGACCLSFGGLIVKSFEGSTLWQILFWRSIFFSITILLFLVFTYKLKFINLKIALRVIFLLLKNLIIKKPILETARHLVSDHNMYDIYFLDLHLLFLEDLPYIL